MSKRTKNKGSVCLYNLIFPIYFIMLVSPLMWLIMICGNFAIDSLVLLVALSILHLPRSIWKKSILRVFLFGFLSDLIGAFVSSLLIWGFWLIPGLSDLISFPILLEDIALSLVGVLVAAFCIYKFNRRFSFRKTKLNPDKIRKLSLTLCLVTTPYFMLVPLNLWYDLLNWFTMIF